MSASRSADWLALAASPVFAAMALLTATHSDGAVAHAGSPLVGMVPMYALMGIVHSAPWLRLIAKRRQISP